MTLTLNLRKPQAAAELHKSRAWRLGCQPGGAPHLENLVEAGRQPWRHLGEMSWAGTTLVPVSFPSALQLLCHICEPKGLLTKLIFTAVAIKNPGRDGEDPMEDQWTP